MSFNQFGELSIYDPETGKTELRATFTCGHCSNITVMHPQRIRPRETCFSCGRWICEDKEICHAQCTPLNALAEDHFEGMGRHGVLVRAIMSGATTVQEAQEKGLILH